MSLFDRIRRRTIRSETNPLDKCTVVSIWPKEFCEHKPTIQPGLFPIKAGSYERPSVLVVGPSSWWREIDENQPLFEVTHSAIQVASAVVNDYMRGYLGCNMTDAKPGLFFVVGSHDSPAIIQNFAKELETAKIRQENFYKNLVKIADIGWAKTNGNPLAINDDMRMAANALNLKNKAWMADFQHMEMIRCVMCGAMRNPLYPMCGNCRQIVDIPLAISLGIPVSNLQAASVENAANSLAQRLAEAKQNKAV